ncbi:hypothetical protein PQE70_gp092 [Bacillus phage vB_BanS_Nate]|uniref:Uncharacterized protein n=1 Tax=Bacillus phage vB_BanS_Nate TaxID=2894788 RepID=A0AAE8YUD7_9CAUD|nr:hypothetical protein PQE70_gp092 [Bacillus phage vB_BanS_Nate]UGO50945.1 hypothetical protein NATE_92 [Bacillus phage vB_BanS_Nate]
MVKKINKDILAILLNNHSQIVKRAEFIVDILYKSKRMMHPFKVVGIHGFTKEHLKVSGYDANGYEDVEEIPLEYIYDDTEVNVMLEEIAEQERIHMENQKYYKELQESEEIKLLKKLIKKYPHITGGE